jgi:hypothetical protein
MYFCNLNENKKLKTRHIVLGLNLAQGQAVLAQPNGYFGMPAQVDCVQHTRGGTTGVGSSADKV